VNVFAPIGFAIKANCADVLAGPVGTMKILHEAGVALEKVTIDDVSVISPAASVAIVPEEPPEIVHAPSAEMLMR
jgi:hypothetical protein